MSERYNPNMGFQGRGFQSGDSICKPMDLTEYYNTNYMPMFDGKGGAAKKLSTSKKDKKHASTKKRGGTDSFDEFAKLNISLPWATQAGGTELASEYYTSAQQGSYAPYNASKNEKYGGEHRGGRGMNGSFSQMEGRRSQNQGSLATADSATKGGNCGCGYKPRTSGTKRGGSDGYYADTITGDDAVVEKISTLNGQLDGGAGKAKKATKPRSSSKEAKKATKPRSSSKGTKSKSKTSSRKHKGGDDSAGVGSDFATTLASRGPCNYPDGKSADLFRIFNKTSEFIPNSMLKYAAAPQSTGYAPDPNPYPRAYNDDFIGGTKKTKSKAKPAKKSTSSSKAKAKPAKKITSSSKAKAKPAKKSSSSKAKVKKH